MNSDPGISTIFGCMYMVCTYIFHERFLHLWLRIAMFSNEMYENIATIISSQGNQFRKIGMFPLVCTLKGNL